MEEMYRNRLERYQSDRRRYPILETQVPEFLKLVAASQVRRLQGLAFQEYFPKKRLSRPKRTPTMVYLEEDNIRRQALENWEIDYYNQDLSFYQDAFDQVDDLNPVMN